MVDAKTISEIKTNINTGIEYEIALFRCLLRNESEAKQVDAVIESRNDARVIKSIIRNTPVHSILLELRNHSLTLTDVSFETQNDDVGPSDLVLKVKRPSGATEQLGLSVKFANTCTLNVTGRKFLTEAQISNLKQMLSRYTDDYISEMSRTYGNVKNWFRARKPSVTTDRYIDLIRDEVILNWSRMTASEKKAILMEAYQETSPIPYWVFTYTTSSYNLNTAPYKISQADIPLVELCKYQTSYVGFYLRGKLIGKMQVKFNNGFVEKCKKTCADKIVDDVRMSFGHPFSSWNFCLV